MRSLSIASTGMLAQQLNVEVISNNIANMNNTGVKPHRAAFQDLHFARLLLPFAVLAFLIGSMVAIFQTDLKRLLAWSSVAQIGYIVVGIGLGSSDGLTGGIVHIFNHALTKAALFMAAGAMFLRIGSTRIDNLAGVGKIMPWTTLAFVLAGLSLIGVPTTAGFVSKWYLVLAALQHGNAGYFLAALILFSSILAVIYVWRVVEVAYFREPAGDATVREAPLSMLVPLWLLTLACFYFGLETQYSVDIARVAAESLLGIAR